MQKAHRMHGRASTGDSLVGKETNPTSDATATSKKTQKTNIREASLS